MKAYRTTDEEIEQAARSVGLRVTRTASDPRRFRLGLADVKPPKPYQRRGFAGYDGRPPRRIAAVCWHGYRDFMRALFAINPGATLASARTTYKGVEDFERRFESTGNANIGSMLSPLAYRDACDCRDNDVRFGTLTPDGELTNVRMIKQSAIMACPFSILVPSHYRDNGRCKCDDADEQDMMIREWGYKRSDFRKVVTA